jgi:hypothetical protein
MALILVLSPPSMAGLAKKAAGSVDMIEGPEHALEGHKKCQLVPV